MQLRIMLDVTLLSAPSNQYLRLKYVNSAHVLKWYFNISLTIHQEMLFTLYAIFFALR